jgi:hypothetical protein
MGIVEFLPQSSGYVRMRLVDGSFHTGHFRTDILSANALSVYFYGDIRDLSLPIEDIDTIEMIDDLQLAS